MKRCLFACLALLLLAGCLDDDATDAPPTEASTADDAPMAAAERIAIPAPSFSPEQLAALEADLAAARATYEAHPDDLDAVIWVGRRLGYLWRYHEAIDVFTEGLEKHPAEPHLLRHRGHRYLSVRNFGAAVRDLARAAVVIEDTEDEVEPDGAPNAAGIPTSTLHTNIYYHLGLAHYLQGAFEPARAAFAQCLAAATNDDMRVATLDWLYMTLRRLGREDEATALLTPVHAGMELLENHAYHRRLLMYKGELPPEALLRVEGDADPDLTFATQGYGVGNWYLYNGDAERAKAVFERVVESPYWPAFGYIAAEADLRLMAE